MSQFNFIKATKKQARARLAISGPSGSGKTMWAPVVATILAGGTVAKVGPFYRAEIEDGKIAFIDTEKGSASLYANQFNFDVLEFPAPYSPIRLREAINAAAAAGYVSVVVDSTTHFWNGIGGVLEIVDNNKKGNSSYTGWAAGTPAQQLLYAAFKDVPVHVIATVRSKMEYVQEQVGGKTTVRKVGMAAVQRDDFVYEFDAVADVDYDHAATFSKTRFPQVADRVFRPEQTIEYAIEFANALAEESVAIASPEQIQSINGLAAQLGLDGNGLAAGLHNAVGVTQLSSLTPESAQTVITRLKAAVAKKAPAAPSEEPKSELPTNEDGSVDESTMLDPAA